MSNCEHVSEESSGAWEQQLEYNRTVMKRRLIAAAWITGATVPALLATVFLVGCCVLPFHRVMHQLMPLCEMAASIVRGDSGAAEHEHDAVPPAEREKRDLTTRIVTVAPETFRLSTSISDQRLSAATSRDSYRSFISHGASRCDQDVGLYTLLDTFLI